MKRFDGVLFCTDLDGTLLKNDGTISKDNIDAIEYFKREGGRFTFVTGRMPFIASHICDAIKPNAPFGCINGGGLYDHTMQKYIWMNEMGKQVGELIRTVDEAFSGVGIQVNTFYKSYFCRENLTMENFRRETGIENIVCHYNEVTEPIAKIIFGSEDDDEILAIEKTLRSHPLASGFDFVRSERTLFEILPKGISKGTAIVKLCEYLGVDKNKTVATGDYNNDIGMFCEAKLGIAVSNACEDAKAAADYIKVSNEEHAIAQVIYDLDSGKYAPKILL